ncbi:MAG: hypothetical protein L0213_13305, partial [Candidatus Dadabacteria bacterium]|nr:hypothetical protein [Candidatus Dadabacteria bacterium]
TGAGRRDAGYYLNGTDVIFTGISDGTVYRLRHIPERARFTAYTDYFTLDATQTGKVLIPERHLKYIADAVDVLYEQRDEEPGREMLADARFMRILDFMLDDIKREPDCYQLPDNSYLY